MNTPRTAAAMLALALFSAGAAHAGPDDVPVPTPRPDTTGDTAPTNNYNQGTTADGKTIVAPGTYGPFQGPTCEAGSAGCTASSANDMAATTNSLLAVGDLQNQDAQGKSTAVDPAKFADVKKEEDKMVASGVYKSIDRTADGKGAVITLPDGTISYSDYVKGFDTMPKKPADILKDPNASVALKAAAQKLLDEQDPDKQQKAAADKHMFGTMGIGDSKKTAPPPATDTTSTPPDAGGGNDQPDANPADMGAWMANNGGLPGGPSGGGMGGSGAGATGGSGRSGSGYAAEKSESDATAETVTAAVGSGRISTDGVDVIQLKHNFETSSGVHDLEHSAAALKGASGDAVGAEFNGNVTQGSKVLR